MVGWTDLLVSKCDKLVRACAANVLREIGECRDRLALTVPDQVPLPLGSFRKFRLMGKPNPVRIDTMKPGDCVSERRGTRQCGPLLLNQKREQGSRQSERESWRLRRAQFWH